LQAEDRSCVKPHPPSRQNRRRRPSRPRRWLHRVQPQRSWPGKKPAWLPSRPSPCGANWKICNSGRPRVESSSPWGMCSLNPARRS
jgi:hypothetical protein